MSTTERVKNALQRGFIDQNIDVEESVMTEFLTNDQTKGITVLESIKQELNHCNNFTFSVAFITESGLNELKTLFLDLKEKGVSGRIITSNYLSFNSPKVFRELLKIENVEVRVTDKEGFHSKGYLFEHDHHTTMILGSSNLTSVALKINHEWNIKISSMYEGEIVTNVKDTVDDMWNDAVKVDNHWITSYSLNYKKPTFLSSSNLVYEEFTGEIIPNKMQVAALSGIKEVRDNNESKALLVSATGTGKTYLSAFDVKDFKPKRFLFVVHREQILNDAIESFIKVIGNDRSEYGILSGIKKDFNAKYLFTTIQTLHKDHILYKFNAEDFEYIVIDESHRAGASSYIKIIDYFKPRFMLGMTATPERPDKVNIFEMFDYNLAYEIRLQEAIEEKLVCPFHYFGVVDYEKDGKIINETSGLKDLVSEERVKHLIEKIEYYGFSGDKVKGLIFVAKQDEAKEISKIMNNYNYKTSFLTNNHGSKYREDQISMLENGELDYLITVDIFNEGIDIPSVNQVVMMRATKSSIVFVQQMGRGLRLHKDKDFLTIIDYIGNYKSNFLIPLALSGDESYNPVNLRKIHFERKYLSGISSVNFEEIAYERVFESLSNNDISSKHFLRKEYYRVKNKIGKVPVMSDFLINDSIDPDIIEKKYKTMYNFILYYDKSSYLEEFKILLTDEMSKFLRMITKMFVNGKRLHEVIMLDLLIKEGRVSFSELERVYRSKGLFYTDRTIKSVISMFDYSYYNGSDLKYYSNFKVIDIEGDNIVVTDYFKKLLNNNSFKMFIEDVIIAAFIKSENYEQSTVLTLGGLYSREDASRLLNFETDYKNTIYGYQTVDNESLIFVKYDKSNVQEDINYGDTFLSNDEMLWYSRHSITLEKNDKKLMEILESKERGNTCRLFVQTSDKIYDSMHYYLGVVEPVVGSSYNAKMKNGKDVVISRLKLNTPISDDLLKYLTMSDKD